MHRPDDDADRRDDPTPPDDAPYTVYGGGSRTPRRPAGPGDDHPRPPRRASSEPDSPASRRAEDPPADDDLPFTVYEAKGPRRPRRARHAAPTPIGPSGPSGPAGPGGPEEPGRSRGRRRRRRGVPGSGIPRGLVRRIVVCGLKLAVAWILLSVVLFVVSATIHQDGGDQDALLGGGGAPFSPTNLLVLGTDSRPPDSKEPGAEGGKGSARTDTMMLMRTGGFTNSKLSIPRDTLVEIPGHGTQKINAAYAFDGVRGAVQAVETLTGINVNHVAIIDFENFPQLIDAMGGIRYKAKTCLTADVSGGAKRPRAGVTVGYDKFLGGTSFRLKKGETYKLEGSAALALARVRKNRCDAGQDDTDRAGRQQQILGAMKRRVISPTGFIRLPLIAWKAPQAVSTDMAGPSLLGVAISQFLPGGGSQAVLKPSGVGTASDGGQGLVVSEAEIARARRAFEK